MGEVGRQRRLVLVEVPGRWVVSVVWIRQGRRPLSWIVLVRVLMVGLEVVVMVGQGGHLLLEVLLLLLVCSIHHRRRGCHVMVAVAGGARSVVRLLNLVGLCERRRRGG